jgi:hypothetical protein
MTDTQLEQIPSILKSIVASVDDEEEEKAASASGSAATDPSTAAATSPGGSPGVLDKFLARLELYTSFSDSSCEDDDEHLGDEPVANLMLLMPNDPSAAEDHQVEQDERSAMTAPVPEHHKMVVDIKRSQSLQIVGFSAPEEEDKHESSSPHTDTTVTSSPGGSPGALDKWLDHERPELHPSPSESTGALAIPALMRAESVPNLLLHAFSKDEDRDDTRSVASEPVSPEYIRIGRLLGDEEESKGESSSNEFSTIKWNDRENSVDLEEELLKAEAERGSEVPHLEEDSDGKIVTEPAPLPIPDDIANLLINVDYVSKLDSISGIGDLSSVGQRVTKDVAKDVFCQRVVPLEIPVDPKPEDVSTLYGGKYDDNATYDDYTHVSDKEQAPWVETSDGDVEQGRRIRVGTRARADAGAQTRQGAGATSSWFGSYFDGITKLELAFLALAGVSLTALAALLVLFL